MGLTSARVVMLFENHIHNLWSYYRGQAKWEGSISHLLNLRWQAEAFQPLFIHICLRRKIFNILDVKILTVSCQAVQKYISSTVQWAWFCQMSSGCSWSSSPYNIYLIFFPRLSPPLQDQIYKACFVVYLDWQTKCENRMSLHNQFSTPPLKLKLTLVLTSKCLGRRCTSVLILSFCAADSRKMKEKKETEALKPVTVWGRGANLAAALVLNTSICLFQSPRQFCSIQWD